MIRNPLLMAALAALLLATPALAQVTGHAATRSRWDDAGRLEYYKGSSYERVLPLAPIVFVDDFMGSKLAKIITGENTVAPWTCLDTDNDADVLLVANTGNGLVNIAVGTTDVTQLSVLYLGDQLPWRMDQNLIMEWRCAIHTLPSSEAGTELPEIEMGFASAHNATADSVATNAWFKMVGDDANIYYESDDGDTDDDDNDSTIDAVADTYHIFRIDCTTAATTKFYIDGALVGTTSMAGLTTTENSVQPYFRVSKTKSSANVGVAAVYLDYVRIWQDRE